MPITERDIRNHFGGNRIQFASAGAVRKWQVRQLDAVVAVLKYGQFVKAFPTRKEADDYVQGCVELDRAGA
jgi:hypothetical protein